MDPISRRFVWDIIEEAKPGRAIVLTTHSMEVSLSACKHCMPSCCRLTFQVFLDIKRHVAMHAKLFAAIFCTPAVYSVKAAMGSYVRRCV